MTSSELPICTLVNMSAIQQRKFIIGIFSGRNKILSDRKMRVKFNGEVSEFLDLIGGGPPRVPSWVRLSMWSRAMTALTVCKKKIDSSI